VDYAHRIALQFPQVAADVRAVSELYVGLRYGKAVLQGDVEKLKALVASFKV
jgi:hypothetical protein